MSSHAALDPAFVRRTLFVFFVAAGFYLAWQLASVALLTFGAVLIAVLLRSISEPIGRHTPLNEAASVGVAGLLVIAVLVGAAWLFESVLADQLIELASKLPTSMAALRAQVLSWPFGDEILGRLGSIQDIGRQFQGVAGRLGGFAMSVTGAITNLVLVIFAGVFLALEPERTASGVLMLVPPASRPAIGHALNASGSALKLWLRGVLVDMLAVGVLTGAGAWIIGLPSPLALGVIAGITDFVPFVGPVVSIVPGALLALTMGPTTLGWTLLMYVAVQQIEGNLIYPFIQRRAVDLPPVLSLIAVLAFGVLFGPLGVVLATPLLVVCFTAAKLLYVRNTLGEKVKVKGE